MNERPRYATGRVLERRRQAVADLHTRGASVPQIARALMMGEATVTKDLRALGIPSRPVGTKNRLPVDPRPVRWWIDGEHDGEHAEPLYRRSVALSVWRTTWETSERERMAEQMYLDGLDARRAEDAEWLSEARRTLAHVAAHVAVLTNALDGRDPSGADDARRPHLKVIRDDR